MAAAPQRLSSRAPRPDTRGARAVCSLGTPQLRAGNAKIKLKPQTRARGGLGLAERCRNDP
eukprot:790522-Lingulodinium_polyedra.AAC.1